MRMALCCQSAYIFALVLLIVAQCYTASGVETAEVFLPNVGDDEETTVLVDPEIAREIMEGRIQVTYINRRNSNGMSRVKLKVDPDAARRVAFDPLATKIAVGPKRRNSVNIARSQKRDRIALHMLFRALGSPELLKTKGLWATNEHVCRWFGVTCGGAALQEEEISLEARGVPELSVTKVELLNLALSGTLPTEIAAMSFLSALQLANNTIEGSIPSELSLMPRLRFLNLNDNRISGTLPSELGSLPLKTVYLTDNMLEGSVLPVNVSGWSQNLKYLDIRRNRMTGTIPSQVGSLSQLRYFAAGGNELESPIPIELFQLGDLGVLDLSQNDFTGNIPQGLSNMQELQRLDLSGNTFRGEFPVEVWSMVNLMTLHLSNNQIGGRLPSSLDNQGWFLLRHLSELSLDHNGFTGSLPVELFVGLKDSISQLDISFNRFSGSVPDEIGQLTWLTRIDAMTNRLTGALPQSMLNLNKNLRLNFTDNHITGKIPGMFCGEGFENMNLFYGTFGCDAVLCSPGTFHEYGHATLHSGCRECPNLSSELQNVLGRTTCEGIEIVHGDADGDGRLSVKEILRLIYLDNLGRFWGPSFQGWATITGDECSLEGVKCDELGIIIEVDLSNANLCSDGDRNPGPIQFCHGLPSEIGLLTSLRVLNLNRRQFLRGPIPSEVSSLSKLTSLDFSSCPLMTGSIPAEMGNLSNLEAFKIAHSRFRGSIPSGIFRLQKLQHLGLTNNQLTGTLPDELDMPSLQDFMISRNSLSGSVPSSIGSLVELVNFEAYGNEFTGTIPPEVSNLTKLKRMDFFNCKMTGHLPGMFPAALQILNVKDNFISGTVPESLGTLNDIFWIDLSDNMIHGTIPSSLGTARALKDLRLSNNMIYDPIPPDLCTNMVINHGGVKAYGCDGILCPLSTYNEYGFATQNVPCKPCAEDKFTIYRGSSNCLQASHADYLLMMHELMRGNEQGPSDLGKNWGNFEEHICDWEGIGCYDGEITSITIPHAGSPITANV